MKHPIEIFTKTSESKKLLNINYDIQEEKQAAKLTIGNVNLGIFRQGAKKVQLVDTKIIANAHGQEFRTAYQSQVLRQTIKTSKKTIFNKIHLNFNPLQEQLYFTTLTLNTTHENLHFSRYIGDKNQECLFKNYINKECNEPQHLFHKIPLQEAKYLAQKKNSNQPFKGIKDFTETFFEKIEKIWRPENFKWIIVYELTKKEIWHAHMLSTSYLPPFTKHENCGLENNLKSCWNCQFIINHIWPYGIVNIRKIETEGVKNQNQLIRYLLKYITKNQELKTLEEQKAKSLGILHRQAFFAFFRQTHKNIPQLLPSEYQEYLEKENEKHRNTPAYNYIGDLYKDIPLEVKKYTKKISNSKANTVYFAGKTYFRELSKPCLNPKKTSHNFIDETPYHIYQKWETNTPESPSENTYELEEYFTKIDDKYIIKPNPKKDFHTPFSQNILPPAININTAQDIAILCINNSSHQIILEQERFYPCKDLERCQITKFHEHTTTEYKLLFFFHTPSTYNFFIKFIKPLISQLSNSSYYSPIIPFKDYKLAPPEHEKLRENTFLEREIDKSNWTPQILSKYKSLWELEEYEEFMRNHISLKKLLYNLYLDRIKRTYIFTSYKNYQTSSYDNLRREGITKTEIEEA